MELIKVDFNSDSIEVIEKNQSIVVKDICEHIGLNAKGQIKRIREDESYESKLIKVQTRGGLQEVFTIPLSKLNGWLFSINPNKVKPEVKQKLIEYKKECFDVLNNYFNKGYAVNNRFNGKNINHIINGYKSQIAQHNQKIKELENKLLTLPNVDYKAKYVKQREIFTNVYEEYWELKSFVNIIKTKINQLTI